MTDRICIWGDCTGKPIARGYCSPHYAKARKRGIIQALPAPDHEALFWAKVDKSDPDGCWPWLGYRRPAGYGQVGRNATGKKQAHRLAYELVIGPIPEGLELDHLCRNPPCVNPAHLEPVTRTENRRREMAAAALLGDPGWTRRRRPANRQPRALLTECRRGHPFDDANTAYYPDGRRRCRACHRDSERRARIKRMTARHAAA